MDLVTEEQPEALYSRWMMQSKLYEQGWEALVCGFEELCRDSSSLPKEEVNLAAEELLSELGQIQGGALSPGQISRLETARDSATK